MGLQEFIHAVVAHQAAWAIPGGQVFEVQLPAEVMVGVGVDISFRESDVGVLEIPRSGLSVESHPIPVGDQVVGGRGARMGGDGPDGVGKLVGFQDCP
jgi:hypothetical protein